MILHWLWKYKSGAFMSNWEVVKFWLIEGRKRPLRPCQIGNFQVVKWNQIIEVTHLNEWSFVADAACDDHFYAELKWKI